MARTSCTFRRRRRRQSQNHPFPIRAHASAACGPCGPPSQDRQGIFRLGVATAARPEGPYAAQPQPMAGSYSIDPAVFYDGARGGGHYLFFGGIWGGQLQRWEGGTYDASAEHAG
jgi:hypothetical protein